MASVLDTRFDSLGRPVLLSRYAPPVAIVDALETGVVTQTRRAQIFEADGITPWSPAGVFEDVERLVDGNVTVDYTADERRKLDITLDNIDNKLRPNPFDGFWYDKIIKVYRGTKFDTPMVKPLVALVESLNPNLIKSQLSTAGLQVDDLTTGTANDPRPGYDFYVAESGTSTITQYLMLQRLWQSGKNVISIGSGNTTTQIPLYTTNTAGPTSWGVSQPVTDSPTTGAFVTEQLTASAAGNLVSGALAGVVALSVWPSPTPTHITAAIGYSVAGGVWLDIHLPSLTSGAAGGEVLKLLKRAVFYITGQTADLDWETQLGEFQIDRIGTANYPDLVKVTARDYTKKMIGSKLKLTSTFSSGLPLVEFIRSIAVNAGIPANKLNLSIGDESLSSAMTFDRGTDRWTMVKNAATAFNYEIFFDSYGNLVVRPFMDPSTSPTSWAFGTGPAGNLIRYDRSTNDSRVFNHVFVYGDPADGQSNVLPYFGEAQVTDPTSPVHPNKIGDRVMPPIVTTFLSSDAEAQILAQSQLKIASLESYELNFESIVYPWLEAGEIVDIQDPLATSVEPTLFLMDSIAIPLGLASMTATGKRITFIGSAGG